MLNARAQIPDMVRGLEDGADEYATKSAETDEMVARVTGLLRRTRRLQPPQNVTHGKVPGFIGAEGGVGTTTVVLNIGVALTKLEKTVIAVELRRFFGSFSFQLGQVPSKILGDLLETEPVRIDERELRLRLTNHPTGLRVLFSSHNVNNHEVILGVQAESIIRELRGISDYLLIDLPYQPSRANQVALRRCDFVILVIEREPGCLLSAKVAVEHIMAWGVREEMMML